MEVSLGGEIWCSAEVSRVEVVGGCASGVHVAGGERVGASWATIANMVAPLLCGRLLDPADLPTRTATATETFELDPSTVKVNWALDIAIPWRSPDSP